MGIYLGENVVDSNDVIAAKRIPKYLTTCTAEQAVEHGRTREDIRSLKSVIGVGESAIKAGIKLLLDNAQAGGDEYEIVAEVPGAGNIPGRLFKPTAFGSKEELVD